MLYFDHGYKIGKSDVLLLINLSDSLLGQIKKIQRCLKIKSDQLSTTWRGNTHFQKVMQSIFWGYNTFNSLNEKLTNV